jgi:hypothetical protein
VKPSAAEGMLATQVAWYCPECRAANASTTGSIERSSSTTAAAPSCVAVGKGSSAPQKMRTDGKKRKRPASSRLSGVRRFENQQRLVSDISSNASGSLGPRALTGGGSGSGNSRSGTRVGIGGVRVEGGSERARRRIVRGDDGRLSVIARDDERPKDIAMELNMDLGGLIRLNKTRLSRLRVDSKLHAGTHLLVPEGIVARLSKRNHFNFNVVAKQPGTNGTSLRGGAHHPRAKTVILAGSDPSAAVGRGAGSNTKDGGSGSSGGSRAQISDAASQRRETDRDGQDVYMAERILNRRSRKVSTKKKRKTKRGAVRDCPQQYSAISTYMLFKFCC